MPLTDDLDRALRERAQELIEEHRLPGTVPARVWGGRGNDEPCALCSQIIRRTEAEYEIESSSATGRRSLRFHFRCLAAWQLECLETTGKASA